MNTIYDDIIYSLQKSGGISVYWQMLEDFISVDRRLVYNNRTKNIFYKERENEQVFESKLFFERYRSVFFDREVPFIFHSSYYRICRNKNAVNITTVHDFTYELFRKDLISALHKIQKKNAVMHSDGIICISENTKRDLYKYYPNYKGKVKVIYHGYDDKTFFFNKKEKINNVLFVGSRTSYKGFNFTVSLLSRIPNLNFKIVGGGELLESENLLLNTMIPNRYEKLGFVSNKELARLYNESFALMYSSEYEGFGFPVIEAQACGCPVICQKKSSIPEISGDKCVYVDSNNLDESVAEINKLFDLHFYRDMQKAGLENVKRFSWEKCVKETLNFYEECFNQKP